MSDKYTAEQIDGAVETLERIASHACLCLTYDEQIEIDDVQAMLRQAAQMMREREVGGAESIASIQVPREELPKQAHFIPHPAWLKLPPGIHDLYTARRAAVPDVIEEIARQWDGCLYDAVGETLDVGECIRRSGNAMLAAAPEVTK